MDVAPIVRAEAGDRSATIFIEAVGPAAASSSYVITAALLSALPMQAVSAPAPLLCNGSSAEFTGLVNDMGT